MDAAFTDIRFRIHYPDKSGSLKRLQTDHIDLYFQHRIDPSVEPEEVAGVMADLIKEGKILYWGILETNEEYLRRAHAVCPVTAVENRYSMMERHYEELFPTLEELGAGLVAFSPMANGLLTGKYKKGVQFDKKYDYRSNMPQFQDEAIDKNQKLLELLQTIAENKHATPAQISMAWTLCKKPWIVPIPGTRKIERMKENMGAADIQLSKEDVETLDHMLDTMPPARPSFRRGSLRNTRSYVVYDGNVRSPRTETATDHCSCDDRGQTDVDSR
ncbi:MAG: aldo/keto reductase [Lachnospiraceae bacterium]